MSQVRATVDRNSTPPDFKLNCKNTQEGGLAGVYVVTRVGEDEENFHVGDIVLAGADDYIILPSGDVVDRAYDHDIDVHVRNLAPGENILVTFTG